MRAGNVIAFGVDGDRGREALVVVAETKADDRDAVRRQVARPGHARSSACRRRTSCWSAPGTLPKTSSGKLQRSLCRSRYHDGQLALVDA